MSIYYGSGGNSGEGRIVQVKHVDLTSVFSTTSGSFQDTGHKVSITPTDSGNKILVLAYAGVNNASSGEGGYCTIYQSGSNISPEGTVMAGYWQENNSNNVEQTAFMSMLHSPGTNTARTYEVRIKVVSGGTFYWGYRTNGCITAIEVTN